VDLGTPLPRLRHTLDIQWTFYRGLRYLVLRDRQALAGDDALLLPESLVPVLAMLDGRRSANAAAAELGRLAGLVVDPIDLLRVVDQLGAALLLDDERAAAARRAATAAFRSTAVRPAALTEGVYPADAAALRVRLDGYGSDAVTPVEPGAVAAVITPHIDYHRGGPVYARLWRAAEAAVRAAEVVVIFGTDHAGGPDAVTLSTPDYQTPLGRLPTDRAAWAAVAAALGDDAIVDELNHRTEHSIELAAVWLQHTRGGAAVPVVPILCGHPAEHMAAAAIAPASRTGRAIAALRPALAGRRVLVVAAADLAHVGPAFGDPAPFDVEAKAAVRRADQALLATCADGVEALLAYAAGIDDRYRICGLSPIACTLAFTGAAVAETVAYDQCPADESGGSIVSVAGVLLRRH